MPAYYYNLLSHFAHEIRNAKKTIYKHLSLQVVVWLKYEGLV